MARCFTADFGVAYRHVFGNATHLLLAATSEALTWHCRTTQQVREPYLPSGTITMDGRSTAHFLCQLADLACRGAIGPGYRVRKGADGKWHLASQVKGLSFAPAPQSNPALATSPPPFPACQHPSVQILDNPILVTSDSDDGVIQLTMADILSGSDDGSICPECGGSVNGRVATCPECGYPLKPTAEAPQPPRSTSTSIKSRLPWFHYAAICFGCTCIFNVFAMAIVGSSELVSLSGVGSLAALALLVYALVDKYAISRGRPAVPHPDLRWLTIGLILIGPMWIVFLLMTFDRLIGTAATALVALLFGVFWYSRRRKTKSTDGVRS